MTATAEITDDLDLGEYSPEAVEKEMETGGRLPPGKYHVELIRVGETTATQRGIMQIPLTFRVLAGPCQGQTHTERLNDFVNGTNEDAKKKSNNRYLLFGSRLGLVSTAGGKYAKVKAGWVDCVGADCVIEIKHEPKKINNVVVPGEFYANVTFGGVYNLTDPKVKDVPRGVPGSRPAAGATAQPAGYDTSDL